MERKCSQSLRIDFPQRVFFGSEITVNIPNTGDNLMVKNIRLVIEFSNYINSLGEKVLERADLLSGDEVIEVLYGEFIHVENNFTVTKEKRQKLSELLCTNVPGTFYMKIPFYTDEIFLFGKTDLNVRLLFSDSYSNQEVFGHLLVDYVVTETIAKTPYVQKTTQIQRFTRNAQTPSQLKMSVYAAGPVYQLYFTVKNTTTGEYVDAIKNIKLYFNEIERFNLDNLYLRYVEPMKRNGVFLEEPMYMYSFCTEPKNTKVPSGASHFPINSYFIIDFYDNNLDYEVTIWAKSHDFLYIDDRKNMKRMFQSKELLLDSTITKVSQLNDPPLKISYTNYSDSVVIFYYSDYDVTNVDVTTNAPSFVKTQNTVEFRRIDSKNSEYTANLVFSVSGFNDTTCYFNILGNNVYLSKINYNSQGQYPTHIDMGQNFHYTYSRNFVGVFDLTNTIFTTSNIDSLNITENKHFTFTGYGPDCQILGNPNIQSGVCGLIAEYDQDLNLVFSKSFPYSQVRAVQSNVYAVDGGFINAFDTQINVTAGSSSVYIHDISLKSATMRITNSSSGININQESPLLFGTNSERLLLLSLDSSFSPIIVSNVSTSITSTVDDSSIWVLGYNTNSYISDSSVSSLIGTQGYLVYTKNWNVRITNVSSTLNGIRPKVITNDMLGITYIVCGYNATTPQLTGFTLRNGPGIFVLKIDSFDGSVQFAVSFTGDILNAYPMLDKVTGKFMMTIETLENPLIYMYNNGTLQYSDYGRYQFFVFDDYGNINSTAQNLNDFFSVPKPLYYKPFPNAEYFSNQPTQQNLNYTYWTSPLIGNGGPTRIVSFEPAPSNDDLYVLTRTDGESSNVFDKYGDTKKYISSISGTGRNFVLYKLYSNCVYSNTLVHITNISADDGDGTKGSLKITTGGYVYILCSTDGGNPKIYERDSITPSATITDETSSLLLLKFDMNGTYQNWYLRVENASGSSLKLDISENFYITGIKKNAGSQNIFINGNSVGTIPATDYTNSSFLIKLLNNQTFSWVSYVDDSTDNTKICCAISSSNGSVYLASTKSGNYSSKINGSGSNTIPPISGEAVYSYVVKFNSSGTYASWYSHLESISGTYSRTSDLSINSNNELHLYIEYNYSKGLYINGSFVATIQNVSTGDPAVSGAIIKYSNSDTYTYNIRMGINGGNYIGPVRIAIDSSNCCYATLQKQGAQLTIRDAQGNEGYVPVSVADTAVIVKINADGSYTNYYGYADTSWFDQYQTCKITSTGDVYTSAILSIFGGGQDAYIYDKNGYVTLFDTPNSYTSVYNIIVKYNSNMTLNKISL